MIAQLWKMLMSSFGYKEDGDDFVIFLEDGEELRLSVHGDRWWLLNSNSEESHGRLWLSAMKDLGQWLQSSIEKIEENLNKIQ